MIMKTTDTGKDRSRPPRTIVIFGAAKTGKSCIIKQFLNQSFDREYHATIEDVYNRKFEVNGHSLDVQFIDTGGFYNFPAMRKLCIKKASGFILVFSVSEQESLFYLTEVLNQINVIHSAGQDNEGWYSRNVPLVVVGNKSDLVNARCVSDDDVFLWLQESQLQIEQFVVTSAKEEDGIWDAFSSLYFQFQKQFPNSDTREAKPSMVSSIRRLSAFAALAVSPTYQMKTFFNTQISPELIKCSSEASSSLSSSSGNSPNFPIGNAPVLPTDRCSKMKRNSRPSLSKMVKETPKSGRVGEPIKLDCAIC